MVNKENKNKVPTIFKITKDQWPFVFKLLTIAFVGIVILNFANFFSGPKAADSQASLLPKNQDTGNDQLVYVPDSNTLESQLENILSEIDGVGDVSVSLVFAEGPTKEYAVNVNTTAREIQEKDQSGGIRTTNEKTENGQMVMGEGNAQPVLVKESMPKIQGILIVAQGAENPLVKEELFQAAKTLLQIPAHRITICSKKGG
ncbi:hypothetical protein [Candidatus Formimonas warabiya]|uniref:Stage III sporulation protein AG n=1 Tax=Formimonas warabiya TaxID=1761012 RepID=A0A3G1KNJ2_FORW1|nr:hypothetical protein [Candidatus Formimonas warabiya]ATW24028.1 hypothetical protein DCMF_03790 [Candidatus Formimonas warabiya]